MTDAWTQAAEIAEKLPPNVPWSFFSTNLAGDAVFRIYAKSDVWHWYRIRLGLGQAEYRYTATMPGEESFEEYTIGSLTLAIIEPEEHDESDGAGAVAGAGGGPARG